MEGPKNYTKEKLTIDIVKANKYSFILLVPILFIFVCPFCVLWYNHQAFLNFVSELTIEMFMLISITSLVIMLLGIVLHELIHGIVWAQCAKGGFKSIKFGVFWKMLTPYCHCTEILNVGQYIIGAIAPTIVLGIIPAIIALFTGSIELLAFGIFFTMSGSGDMMMINLIRKEKSKDLVLDHPSELGCYIYRKTKS